MNDDTKQFTTQPMTVEDVTVTTAMPSAERPGDETRMLRTDDDADADAKTEVIDQPVTNADSASDSDPAPIAVAGDACDKDVPIGDLPLKGESIPPADDVPLYGEMVDAKHTDDVPSASRPETPQPETSQKPQPVAGDGAAASGADSGSSSADAEDAGKPGGPDTSDTSPNKRGVSTPTVVFGLLGLLIGVVAMVFGLVFPNTLIPAFTAGPQIVVAVACAVVGVILVIVAVVWAVMGAVKSGRNAAA